MTEIEQDQIAEIVEKVEELQVTLARNGYYEAAGKCADILYRLKEIQ